MQGKGVVKFFAILLAIVCLYQLSFTWVADKVENDAKVHAKGDTSKVTSYLDSMATVPVYPILKYNYQEVKQNALSLGLDLAGGMSVTMQISLNELVKKLSNNNADVVFNQALVNAANDQRTNETDYITLFVNEYEKLNPNGKLAAIFATRDNQDNLKFNATNSEVEKYLKDQASVAVQQSYTILNTRIDQFGVANANIQLQKGTDRILIEIPGVKDPERVRKLLSGTAKLEFYETYDNTQAYAVIQSVNNIIAAKLKSANKDTAKSISKLPAAKTDTAKSGLTLLNKVKNNASKDTSKLGAQSQLFKSKPFIKRIVPAYL